MKDTRERRYIRITDIESWKLIDEISQVDRYKKSFNKIINDALYYGLPELHNAIYGEVKLDKLPSSQNSNILCFNQEQYNIILRLLKEMVLNATINKSILSSLFHVKQKEQSGESIDVNEFRQGYLSDTPNYLHDYELEGIKSLRRQIFLHLLTPRPNCSIMQSIV